MTLPEEEMEEKELKRLRESWRQERWGGGKLEDDDLADDEDHQDEEDEEDEILELFGE